MFHIVMGLTGGLALLLYGMEKMADALKTVAGGRLKAALSKLTTNRISALFTGAFVTALIQSSSVTTVLVVGFITAELMTLTESIGIIMGANIGTTVTAQIIALKVTRYALLMIAVGFALRTLSRRERLRHWGTAVFGLGMVFFGMNLMGGALEPMRSHQPFLDAMVTMRNPWIGILTGTLFTAVIQSSAATTGIVIVLSSGGLIDLPAGIALIFGANVGTCITAVLGALGKPREALRAATAHVLFNLAGVLVWVAFIDDLAVIVRALSADPARQIAHAHTVFNVANAVLFLPWTNGFAWLILRLLPDRPGGEVRGVRAKYLDEELLSTPSLALDRVRLEILHLGNRVKDMLEAILPAVLTGSRQSLTEIALRDDDTDALHGQIVTYLGRISQEELADEHREEFMRLMDAANHLESIGDIIELNLVSVGRERIEQEVVPSEATREVLEGFHRAVIRALEASLLAVTQKNPAAAQVVIDMKKEINRLARSAALHEARRLVAEEPNRLPAYTVEIDILENLKRVYYFAKRIARVEVGRAGKR